MRDYENDKEETENGLADQRQENDTLIRLSNSTIRNDCVAEKPLD
jgi:hypothetical protein